MLTLHQGHECSPIDKLIEKSRNNLIDKTAQRKEREDDLVDAMRNVRRVLSQLNSDFEVILHLKLGILCHILNNF